MLFAFEGSTGDLFPFIFVAKMLRKWGLWVVFCCSSDMSHHLNKNDFWNYENEVVNSEVLKMIIANEKENGNVGTETMRVLTALVKGMIWNKGSHFNSIKLLITNLWSLYTALLMDHNNYEIMILAPQPLGLIEKDGIDIMSQKKITTMMKLTLNSNIS